MTRQLALIILLTAVVTNAWADAYSPSLPELAAMGEPTSQWAPPRPVPSIACCWTEAAWRTT